MSVDGGAAANNALLQFQADLLGVPVRRPVVNETTALGAAYLAGLAVGYWGSADDVTENWALDREFVPTMDAATRDRLYRGMEEGRHALARLGRQIVSALTSTTPRKGPKPSAGSKIFVSVPFTCGSSTFDGWAAAIDGGHARAACAGTLGRTRRPAARACRRATRHARS